MSFIIKNAISGLYNRCVEMLDKFDSKQIEAIYDYFHMLNQTYGIYEIKENPSRVHILEYLIKIKNNENNLDERVVFDKLTNITHAMVAMELLKQKYIANHAA